MTYYYELMQIPPKSKSEARSVTELVQEEISRLSAKAYKANHVHNNDTDRRKYSDESRKLQEAFNRYDESLIPFYDRLPK